MVKKRYLLLIWMLGAMISCVQESKTDAEAIITHVNKTFAPDKRVALFDIQWEDGELRGETNLPEALTQLKDSLTSQRINFKDKVTLLPDDSLNGHHFAVITLSVANIRSQPKHSAELATQATMGTPLKVLKKLEGWYLVQTPDKYISWVDAGGIALMDEDGMNTWYSSEKSFFTPLNGFVYECPNKKSRISDLTAGNILEVLEKGEEFHQVKLPDGRKGYVSASNLIPYAKWISSRNTSPTNLISTATDMMGVPYLWGGTSIKGVDCSGFTKTIFFLNGKIIPRDASQQIHEGEEVDTEKNWENLEIGDLLFFGVPGTNESPERVVHVGMWIGDHSFIHSRGRVRVSSFDPSSENYDEYELNRYLRSKRIVGKNSKNVLAVNEIIH